VTLPVDQVLLLRAALLDGPPAAQAWREWRAGADLETIDRGSARLVPLLWHNLLANGITDDWLPRFKGVYRHTWLANQLRLRRLRAILATLGDAGVEGVVLKGIALASAYYPNPGLRPMDDLDVLVAPDDVPAALAALAGAGWVSTVARPERVLRVVHGIELRDSDGERLDLHAHVFQGSLDSALDARRRERAEVLELADGRLRVLEATDQLLHVLVHGLESDPPAPRWLADATMVLRRAGTRIDWPRLLADAAAESRALAVARALVELDAVIGRDALALPAEVLAQARLHRPTLGERFEHRVASGGRLFAVGFLVRRVVDYRRWRRADRGASRAGTGFLGYLRLNWGLDSLRQLPGQVVRRGLRSVSQDLGGLLARARGRGTSSA
jgi:hypothetical protein